MEGRSDGLHPRESMSSLGVNFSSGGQLHHWRLKFAPWGEIKNYLRALSNTYFNFIAALPDLIEGESGQDHLFLKNVTMYVYLTYTFSIIHHHTSHFI
jgi:hypothetical protein